MADTPNGGTSTLYPGRFKQPTQLFRDSFNASGKFEVQVSDQTTRPIMIPMTEMNPDTTITAPVAEGTKSITVDNIAGFIDGADIIMTDPVSGQFFYGHQVGVIVGNTIEVDSPIQGDYPIGATIRAGTDNMAVDGSVVTRTFKLRPEPGAGNIVDITRLIFYCECNNAVDLSKFGDIVGGLTYGCALHYHNDVNYNIMNVKKNGHFAQMAYDFTTFSASNPAQGVNGFVSRLTFAGQSKIGVALRLGPTDNLHIDIQDDLSGLIEFKIICEGHVVED